MKSNVRFVPIMTGLNKPVTQKLADTRGKERTIKFYSGYNTGKRYPYASDRQLNRKYGASRKVSNG